jgi:DNA-binding transcriptional regulator YdaS (Cro superfamily)
MEKLALYLTGKKKRDFAEAIGTSPSYLSQLLSGHRRPSFDMMLRIERVTDGAVDVHAWRSCEPEGVK